MTSASGAGALVLGAIAALAIAPASASHSAPVSASHSARVRSPAYERADAGYRDLAVPLPGPAGSRPGAGGSAPGPAGQAAAQGAAQIRLAGSLNWAGYAASRRTVTFRAVSATFFVPYLNCAKSPGATLSSAWAGLDGFTATSQTVEQTGIAADCSASGSASYFGWFEMFPFAETRLPIRIRPGDSVTATVSFDSASRQFRLTLTDNTSGEHVVRDRRCPAVKINGTTVRCARSSAEIIAEAPATGTSQHTVIAPLSDYGAISFARIAITDSKGHRDGIISKHWTTTRITQLRGSHGPILALPTSIAGDMFSDYWLRES